MFCPNCGGNLPENSTLCSECGTTISSKTPVYQEAPKLISDPGKGLGIASLILGIVSYTCCGGFLTAIAGLITGLMGRSKSKKAGIKNGMALAGTILSIIAIVTSILTIVFFVVYFVFILGLSSVDSIMDYYMYY